MYWAIQNCSPISLIFIERISDSAAYRQKQRSDFIGKKLETNSHYSVPYSNIYIYIYFYIYIYAYNIDTFGLKKQFRISGKSMGFFYFEAETKP
mgnify:CR=1 FL=1